MKKWFGGILLAAMTFMLAGTVQAEIYEDEYVSFELENADFHYMERYFDEDGEINYFFRDAQLFIDSGLPFVDIYCIHVDRATFDCILETGGVGIEALDSDNFYQVPPNGLEIRDTSDGWRDYCLTYDQGVKIIERSIRILDYKYTGESPDSDVLAVVAMGQALQQTGDDSCYLALYNSITLKRDNPEIYFNTGRKNIREYIYYSGHWDTLTAQKVSNLMQEADQEKQSGGYQSDILSPYADEVSYALSQIGDDVTLDYYRVSMNSLLNAFTDAIWNSDEAAMDNALYNISMLNGIGKSHSEYSDRPGGRSGEENSQENMGDTSKFSYLGKWVQPWGNFNIYVPDGWEEDNYDGHIQPDGGVYVTINQAQNISIQVFAGQVDYNPTPEGIYNYVLSMGAENVQYMSCDGITAVAFDQGFNRLLAFADEYGYVISLDVYSPNPQTRTRYAKDLFESLQVVK